jgi:hypothetical protein
VSARRRLSLEIEPDSDPLVGALRDEHGESIAFSGWLGLANAIDRALRVAPAAADGAEPTADADDTSSCS